MKKKSFNLIIVLFIILICTISFGGIYVKKQGNYKNVLPEYNLGRDLKGSRIITLNVSDETKEIIRDKEGNIIESATDEQIKSNGYTKSEEKINSEDKLTSENFNKDKKIIETRLKNFEIDNIVRQEKNSGNFIIEVSEQNNTDEIVSYLSTKGEFIVKDSDTNEILLDNSYLKNSRVMLDTSTNPVTIYLEINLNKEGALKLEEITKTYVKTKDEEENEVEKNITMTLDDTTLLTTYFEETITNGKIQLSMGKGVTTDELQKYLGQARNISSLLNSGKLNLEYELENNLYIQENFEKNIVIIVVLAILTAILYICMIIKYKRKGISCVLANIVNLAIILLMSRYINDIVITLNAIIAVFAIVIINYIFSKKLLEKLENIKGIGETKSVINNWFIKSILIIVPILILSIVFCFMPYLQVETLGMVLFWGIVSTIVSNVLFTKTLLVNNERK